jgi:DNA (cytosine-5)-methyltransferase 1
MTLIELFAGIGTQHKAMPWAEVLGVSEIDERPLKIYRHLFGEVKNFGDITKIEKLPKADIWTYSFPCTDLSIAGNKAGFSGEKSSLIYEVYRLLQVSEKPKILLMENVANLVSVNFIGGFKEWIKLLEDLGYTTTWQKMKACDYGGYTIRDRVFAVSVLDDKPFVFPKKIPSKKTIRDILEPADINFRVDDGFEYNAIKTYTKAVKIKDYNNGGQGNRIYSIDAPGITLTATGGGKGGTSGLYLRDEGIYKLSSIEMAKAMGWDKEEALKMKEVASDRELGFVLGNAIDLSVLTILCDEIKNQYFMGV